MATAGKSAQQRGEQNIHHCVKLCPRHFAKGGTQAYTINCNRRDYRQNLGGHLVGSWRDFVEYSSLEQRQDPVD